MSNIKIFVSHRIDLDSETIDNPLLIPVRSGSVFDMRKDVTMPGDDTGINISEKNRSYCEITLQYWAWKNADADYYGLCHYRRYLNFSSFRYPKDEYGLVQEKYLNKDAERVYGLKEDTMRAVIEKYDIILPDPVRLSSLPGHPHSIREHWAQAKELHIEDLNLLLDVIAQLQPDYYQDAKEYLDGDLAYFCNIFVMKRQIFFDYCEWLFPILGELEKQINSEYYSVEGKRVIGHLAERLVGIYIAHLRRYNHTLRIKELQMVLFQHTEKTTTRLSPAFSFAQSKQIIPIVFSANNQFAPVCGVAIQSIIEHVNPDINYDIVLLGTDISAENKRLIKSLPKGKENISIRFCDVSAIVKPYVLTASEHISVETYYRFLIQSLLPDYDKVIYLDGDLVCNCDIAELFQEDIDGYLLAATYDPDMSGQISLNSNTLRYLIREVKMEDPYSYFQAGVLLLNTKEMRSTHSLEEWFAFAGKKYRYLDQDILNRYCQGRVKYLDMSWNTLIDCNNYRVPVLIRGAKASINEQYQNARKAPRIVHFAGFQKPWNQRGVDMETEFWKYARITPFYEQFLFSVFLSASANNDSLSPIGVKGTLKIWIKKKGDKWFPKGTKRRGIMKRLFGWLIK